MASTQKRQTGKAADNPPAEPVAEPEQTTDYTRRAGGFVLTDHGWVPEES